MDLLTGRGNDIRDDIDHLDNTYLILKSKN